MLGYQHHHPKAAAVGEAETTMEPKAYRHPLLPALALWDMPGIGTPRHPHKDYFENYCLGAFDALLVVFDDRFMATDVDLARKAARYNVPVFFIKNKADLSIERKIQRLKTRQLSDTEKWAQAKLVDKDSFNNTKFTKNDTKKTISELRALTVTERRAPTQRTVTSVKRSAANDTKSTAADKKRPASSAAKKTTTATTNARTTSARTKPKEQVKERTKEKPKEQPAQQEVPTLNENSVCIFCDEVNPEFNEDTLIKHYYNSCPVLTNCPMCRMITEISTLNEHMLIDCEKRHLTKECTRCHLAIPVEQWLQHTLKQTCPNVIDSSTTAICPLCTVDIEPPNESGWKLHLMMGDGCPKLKKSRSPKKQQPQPQQQQQQQQQQTRRKVTKTAIKK
ncbi:hypothetical protein RMCBS344292_05654 [Rhizopus microsporus]|nr:hypothetical protein RMCBS344292_05654 [Rhizopus microsporus]